MCHDLRKYLREGKRGDLTTLGGECPVWKANGRCHAGWKCRFVGTHMEEVELDDGRKELRLTVDSNRATGAELEENESRAGVFNVVTTEQKLTLSRRKMKTDKADAYEQWMEKEGKELERTYHKQKKEDQKDHQANYTEPPFKPSEKKRIYFGPDTLS